MSSPRAGRVGTHQHNTPGVAAYLRQRGGARRIRIKSQFSLGDIVVLSGALRDLHLAEPGRFVTTVDTFHPEVWQHNPYISEDTLDAVEIDCHDLVVDRTGRRNIHYLQACLDLLNRKLGTQASLTALKGDIHLSWEERNWYSDIWSLCGKEVPYWIICPGGKFDIPIKWWDPQRWQEVVNHFRGRIQFVQVGWWGNYHPPLEGVIDLRGQTRTRDLIHLVYNADGVFCGVTSLMHLAAAVPTAHGNPRPAVIVGGAREPAVWEAYPGHEFISTEAQVSCAHCWKPTHIPLPGRSRRRNQICDSQRNSLPSCMDLVTAASVIERFEKILADGRTRALSARFYSFGETAREQAARASDYDRENVHLLNARRKSEEFIARIRPYPVGRHTGRGIILCSGGVRYFTSAWICIRLLRQHGCRLPIQVWHLGRHEMDRRMESLLAPLGVECINARRVMDRYPFRNPLGWELKSYAILHSRFREILFLDSDNVPVRNPEFLFDSPEYLQHGAIFWPDCNRLSRRHPIWKITGIPWRDEPEFETGQMLINKKKCWDAVNLAFWYNDHSEFFYQFIHGDKETFHLAWRKLERPYSMPQKPVSLIPGTMCQHDLDGALLFQHRNRAKWTLLGPNLRVPGFQFEPDCLRHLEELRREWDGRIQGRAPIEERNGFHFRQDTSDKSIFLQVVSQNEYCLADSLENKTVLDVGAHIGSFAVAAAARGARRVLAFEPQRDNFELASLNLRHRRSVELLHGAILNAPGKAGWTYSENAETGNTGAVEVTPDASGDIPVYSFDNLLEGHGQIDLAKLDCEGSEWPILLHSRQLRRLHTICGEYHERPSHPLCPRVSQRLDARFLRGFLATHFPHVRVQPSGSGLGLFWASQAPLSF